MNITVISNILLLTCWFQNKIKIFSYLNLNFVIFFKCIIKIFLKVYTKVNWFTAGLGFLKTLNEYNTLYAI